MYNSNIKEMLTTVKRDDSNPSGSARNLFDGTGAHWASPDKDANIWITFKHPWKLESVKMKWWGYSHADQFKVR